MKLCLIHHTTISEIVPPHNGATIRLQHICQGLRHHLPNLRMVSLCKENTEGNWKTHIQRHLIEAKPDVVLCNQLEDVALLPPRDTMPNTPVIVDLYAPRLLEGLFEIDNGHVAHQLLLALYRADAYLIAHELQREHWCALLRLAGIQDLARLIVTPLAVDVQPNEHLNDLTLVGGGRVWPWQNPWNNLRSLLSILDQHNLGQVTWFSPPDNHIPIKHPRLQIQPWGSRSNYRSVIAQSTLGLDLNPSSPERFLACAFRHMEFLGCGVSILSANHNTLTRSEPKLCHYVDFENEANVLKALQTRTPQRRLKGFQEAHQPSNVVGPLIEWLTSGTCREVHSHCVIDALVATQQNFDAMAQLEEMETQVEALTLTHQKQTLLLEQANEQVQQGSASLLKVSTALEQVSAFKNDIAHNWADLMHQQQERINNLEDALRLAHAENAKKSAELHAMDLLRARLENDLQHVRAELDRQSRSRWRL